VPWLITQGQVEWQGTPAFGVFVWICWVVKLKVCLKWQKALLGWDKRSSCVFRLAAVLWSVSDFLHAVFFKAFCFSLFLQRGYVCGQVYQSITRHAKILSSRLSLSVMSRKPNQGGPFPWPAVRDPQFACWRFDMVTMPSDLCWDERFVPDSKPLDSRFLQLCVGGIASIAKVKNFYSSQVQQTRQHSCHVAVLRTDGKFGIPRQVFECLWFTTWMWGHELLGSTLSRPGSRIVLCESLWRLPKQFRLLDWFNRLVILSRAHDVRVPDGLCVTRVANQVCFLSISEDAHRGVSSSGIG
jgi:hypothetical protein